ncbi:hypothetical protein [Botrimarina mediterranea]|uniref:Uncharacterized protein n=1 Tax=Botrimarina mediterranea TaxID=2528022 RepID=A0A518KE99_9BACT|nr:hypothetical protein [Botrimarina mediterranea]QDV76120.1 hypothetical protein Spa11_43450 [Botrimarina mediterranea]QDV80718.1 hypothetical protein K2D_43480 [Planctomycetes bacterium K2D]
MANTMRWRYGDTNPVMLPVAADVAVEIGDLVYLAEGMARPASALANQGSSVLNLSGFHDAFVGVAMQASPVGTASSIRIATSGAFEFDCDSATHGLGDFISVGINLAGDQLIDQKVADAASVGVAIGRCAKQVTVAATRVLVDVVSTVMKGGPQEAA